MSLLPFMLGVSILFGEIKFLFDLFDVFFEQLSPLHLDFLSLKSKNTETWMFWYTVCLRNYLVQVVRQTK